MYNVRSNNLFHLNLLFVIQVGNMVNDSLYQLFFSSSEELLGRVDVFLFNESEALREHQIIEFSRILIHDISWN